MTQPDFTSAFTCNHSDDIFSFMMSYSTYRKSSYCSNYFMGIHYPQIFPVYQGESPLKVYEEFIFLFF